MQPRTTPPGRRPSTRRPRGAAALETALSMVILVFVMTAGIQFGDAMVIRHRMTTAANRAVRICSVMGLNPANAGACVSNQVAQAMGQAAGRCDNLAVQHNVQDVNGVQVLSAQVACAYGGGPWSGLVRRWVQGGIRLQAQAAMPMQ